MRIVWMVIVAATGAMSLIAASLLAPPNKRSEFRPSFDERAVFHFACDDCGHHRYLQGELRQVERFLN